MTGKPYKGQDAQIDSVGLWSLILVRPELPDGVVYRLARAIHRGEGALAERLQQGRYKTARNTATQVPAEHLHRGTARYYREARFSTVKGRKSNGIATDMPSPTAIPADGIGCIRRTDFQGGDAATLYRSIHDKLFSLHGETLVYAAHDYEGRRISSIAQEKQRNPRLSN